MRERAGARWTDAEKRVRGGGEEPMSRSGGGVDAGDAAEAELPADQREVLLASTTGRGCRRREVVRRRWGPR